MATISKDSVKDSGKVRIGAGMKQAAAPKAAPASVKDSGKVRIGAGMKRRPT